MNIPDKKGCYVYLIRCSDDSLYCGWTTNLLKRYELHCRGKGAKYTKSHPPIELYYWEELASSQEARKREYEIKQFTRQEKLKLPNRNKEKNFAHIDIELTS